MIGFLSGTILETYPTIVNVGGVGYRVHLPEATAAKIIQGTTESFYIHTHVREDALDLYGFCSKEELALFELLLTVSGIGPRTSLSIIDRGASAIGKAVREGDVDFFTAIPRLGHKNAQKIIIELKSKLGSLQELDLTGDNGETKELIDALISIGFTKNESLATIKKLDGTEETIEQKILGALKILGKK